MSYSWRERLREKLKKKEILLDKDEIEHLEKYIEQYCSEADRQCRIIDPNKAVDLVVDEMTDEEFKKFTKKVIDEVKKRIEKRKKQKAKKKKKQTVEVTA